MFQNAYKCFSILNDLRLANFTRKRLKSQLFMNGWGGGYEWEGVHAQNEAKSAAKVSVRESKMCRGEGRCPQTPSPASNIYFVFLLLFALFFELVLFYIVSQILEVSAGFVTYGVTVLNKLILFDL